MAPIEGCDGPFEAATAQNVLDTQSYQGCVFAIVIERIAIGDAFDDEPSGFVEASGNLRLLITINSAVGLGEVPTQRIS